MFGRKKPQLVSSNDKPKSSDDTPSNPELIKELSARYASLFMICYKRGDVSAMHITFTAFTHTLHALKVWDRKQEVMELTKAYILHDGFPVDEIKALQWLLNHYFEQPNEGDESILLNWYQYLDDEWVLRKKLREMFPDKTNSELTALIAIEQAKQNEKAHDLTQSPTQSSTED